jgi:hypothetical protein
MRTAIILSGFFFGCNADFQSTVDEDKALVAEDACESIARTLSPASAGLTNFFYRDDIVFSVTDGADTATISLTDSSGVSIEGETWVDDRVAADEPLRVVFTPTDALHANTAYSATLAYCAGNPTVDFTTSELGTPIDGLERISGAVFSMDMSAAKVVQPSGVAQVLLTLLDNDLALRVDGATDDTLDIAVASVRVDDGLQDTCTPTLDFSMPGNFAQAPAFEVGPIDVPFDLAGNTVMLYDAHSSATFASNGTHFAGGRMSGAVDARDVVVALAGQGVLPSENPEALCDLLGDHSLGCSPCRDGEEYCLYLEVADIQGEKTEVYIEDIDSVDCHADCEDSCENETCEIAEEFAVCAG